MNKSASRWQRSEHQASEFCCPRGAAHKKAPTVTSGGFKVKSVVSQPLLDLAVVARLVQSSEQVLHIEITFHGERLGALGGSVAGGAGDVLHGIRDAGDALATT